MSKKQSIEDSMKEILDDMNERFENARSKKHEIDEEIAQSEDKLHITRERISDSRKELSGLQTSVGNLKLEHEEQRGFVTRLTTKKTKLLEEISKSQALLHKYEQIKEKVKIEEALSKNEEEDGYFKGKELLVEKKRNEEKEKSRDE
jgi:hypothetical protein